MVANSLSDYEDLAVKLATSEMRLKDETSGISSDTRGELTQLRRDLYMNRHRMPLFDTIRWTRNLEKGYEIIWTRWLRGASFLHFTRSGGEGDDSCDGHVRIEDDGGNSTV